MSSHICYLPTHFARRGIMETSEKWTFNCLVFSCHVFKWWSENQTRFSPVFKWHSNTGPFGDQTSFDHLNTNCSCLVESCFWTQRLNQEKCLLKKQASLLVPARASTTWRRAMELGRSSRCSPGSRCSLTSQSENNFWFIRNGAAA